MLKKTKESEFNFTKSFKETVQKYETLSAGKKADYERTQRKAKARVARRSFSESAAH